MLRTGGSCISTPQIDPKPIGPVLATANRPSARNCTPEEVEHCSKLAAHQHARAQTAIPRSILVLLSSTLLALAELPTSAAPLSGSQPSTRAVNVTEPADPWLHHIPEAARRFAIPEPWIRAVIEVESAGDVHATSPKSARGLMQIMPTTWDELRAKHDLGNDPYLPRDNILAGAAYLRQMLDRFGKTGFLAAYHAGPSRYEAYLATGRPLPTETVKYVAKVTSLVGGAAHNPPRPSQSTSRQTASPSPISLHAERISDVDRPLHGREAVAPLETVFTAIRRTGNLSPVGAHVRDLTGIVPSPLAPSDSVSSRRNSDPVDLFVRRSAAEP